MAYSDLAQAIAHSEGYGVEGAIPTRAHNPGDMVCPWLKGDKLGAEGIHVFPDESAGWAALEHQLDLIKHGKSQVYLNSMTIAQMARLWTRTESTAWAENVADWLASHGRSHVTTQTILRDIL